MNMPSVAVARCNGCFTTTPGGPCDACAVQTDVWSALRRGTTLAYGRYVLGKPLGDPGGFGITYYAWDCTLERRVAVKEFYPQFLQPVRLENGTVSVSSPSGSELFATFLSGFLEEGRRAAAVGHEHVVKILDFLEAFGTGYLIMPYYEGETLGAYQERHGNGPIPWREVLALTLPIVDALRAVHEVGVIHRDVKPANIYLANGTDGPRPILLDFGAARVAGSARQFTTVLTERYAPLEQYDAEAAAQGPWTDIYAMAATILELLTGQRLPPAPSRQIGTPMPELAVAQPDAPRQLSAALERALRLDPAERTREAKAFYAELRQSLDKPSAPKTHVAALARTALPEQRTPTRPSTTLVTNGVVPHRSRRWVPIAAMAAVVVMAAAASYVWVFDSPPTTASQKPAPDLPSLPPAPVPTGLRRGPDDGTRAAVLKNTQTPIVARTGSGGAGKSAASERRAEDRDSAERLLEKADYTGAWVRASRANAAELLKRITDACRADSLIAARRNIIVGCPH